jgi:N-acetyl-anhydromuramyl-L-alanine amidase AmpD
MLTDNQLARAVGANPRWRGDLGPAWPSNQQLAEAGIPPLQGEGDFAFADAVAAFQASHDLACDGILGRLTSAKLRGVAPPAPKGEAFLIVGGEKRPAPDCRIVTWQDPDGLGFAHLKVWRPRPPGPIDLFVLHHDGCRSSRQCYDVLAERKLSVHLMLDRDGTIYQALDLRTACAYHASEANQRSIGVEICNPVRIERDDPKDPRPVGILEVTNAGAEGARRSVLGFYPKQVEAVIALARAISSIFAIPLQLPQASSPTSTAGVTRGIDARVVQGSFRGICGHYHLKETKIDPGVSLWQPMRDAGVGLG